MLVEIFALALQLVFPAVSLADPVAGKIFSLLAGSGNLAQRLDMTRDSRSNRADFAAETRNFPAFSLSAGKIRGEPFGLE
jgi:hypothetical protein